MITVPALNEENGRKGGPAAKESAHVSEVVVGR
jgi:hypothetical protein